MNLLASLFPPPSRSIPLGEMKPMEISTLTLVLALVSGLTAVVSANQQPFNLTWSPDSGISRSSTGILRRFSDLDTLDIVLGAAQSHDLDIWQLTPNYVDIYVGPENAEKDLPEELQGIRHTMSEIDASIPKQFSQPTTFSQWNLSTTGPKNNTFHDSYHPLHEIDMFIAELVDSFPELVTVIKLGHSAEGREMLGVKLSRNAGKKARLGFVIHGAQHAREWVATATALYLAHALVTTLQGLLDKFDFYIIPTPNPDGYTYTWESDRFWYKNRQIMGPNAKCVGLDMGRNWGYKWKATAIGGGDNLQDDDDTDAESALPYDLLKTQNEKEQTPVDPCSHWYPGHRPFESPEANNIANFITTLPNLRAFLDLRTYGQMLSPPYSYTCKVLPRDAEDQFEAATGAAAALGQVHGTKVRVGTLCEQLYKAPGNVIDWMYKRAGIKYSYAVHLRDTGTYGFSLPPEWIRPVGEETSGMMEYLAKFIITPWGP